MDSTIWFGYVSVVKVNARVLMCPRVQVLELCLRLRIHCVTVYAFAIENFNRPKEEVDTIMKLAEERLVEIAQRGYVRVLCHPARFIHASRQSEILDKHGVRLNVLGRRELLPPSVQVAIEKAENMTRHNNAWVLFFLVFTTCSHPGRDSAILNVCAPYASQDEITTAVESVIQEALNTGDLDGR